MPSARGRRVRMADEEQHLTFDPSCPVIPEREVHPSTAEDTFESLFDEVRRDELSSIALHRDGYRTRYAPPGSARSYIDRDEPSLQEFLDSSEDYFPASGADTTTTTDATELGDDINTSRSAFACSTFSSKENIKSSRAPAAANTYGLKESVKSSVDSPSTVNTSAFRENVKPSSSLSATNKSAPKEGVKPSGSPSFATLRHKLSSMFSGEASGRDDNCNQATPPMPVLPGNIATMPFHDTGIFGLNNQQCQATQTQATSADLSRPAAMANPTKIASSATVMSSATTAGSAMMASPPIIGNPISTSSFAAKVKDKATRQRPLLTVDTTRSNKSAPITALSSPCRQSKNQNDEYGSSKIDEGSMTRPGPTDQLSLTTQEAYEDEVPIYTRSHPIVKKFEAAYLEEAFEVSSIRDLIATDEASTATTEPPSSFMSPTKLGKALRRNFANLKLAKPDSTYNKSDTSKGAIPSPGESSVPQANLHRETIYSKPPSPAISRFGQASTSARNNQHASRPTATTASASKQTSATSPGPFRILRKSVGSGDARAISDSKKVPKNAQRSSQGKSSTSAAQGREEPKESAKDLKAKAKMEREDFVAFKVNELREQTGSQVVWYSPDDLRCKHPNHPRTWYSKNLWCGMHSGACANCGAPCCAMAGAIEIVEENSGTATAVAAAKTLSQAIGLYVTAGEEESTLMECTSCHCLVCPDCCSVCPVGACGDRVCNASPCNPDRQWEICDLHDE